MKIKKTYFNKLKSKANYFIFLVLVGYLLILIFSGLHHHKLNLISISDYQHITTQNSQPVHNYEKCEINYFANSLVSYINSVPNNFNYLLKNIIPRIENDSFFYSTLSYSNYFRGPPINL